MLDDASNFNKERQKSKVLFDEMVQIKDDFSDN